MSKPKKRRPSFDIARPDGSETRAAGWVYRSDQPSNGTPEAEGAPRLRTEVEFIPPGRGTLRRVPPPPAERPLVGIPLSALSFGVGVAMMPVFATMLAVMVPMRWLFGASPTSQTAGAPR